MTKIKSIYSAALTGCSFMIDEMNACLPMLMNDNSESLMKQEVSDGTILMMKSERTRSRATVEFKKRFKAVPKEFWEKYLNMPRQQQLMAMYYVCLKTYRILFDLHINVALRKWKSANRIVTKNEAMSEIYEIAANDEFVDSWSEETKDRVASAFLTFMRKAGLLNESGELQAPKLQESEYAIFIEMGEEWFLQACFLEVFEIERIKENLKR
ncbi:BrxA family protein [uncultured Prevotella sp.]|uniref:BrxA family protein n=1 Tax=uncultured Prevotella sp. TaxID=159272 RepID=UPI00258BABAD|nr:BrxA family protein [uncultured Prevotella sp.]